jgi:hypothetical protein
VAVVAHLDVLGVQPQVGELALERSLAEDLDLLIERPAERRDAVLRHALDAELLDQAIDLARRDTVHLGLHHPPPRSPARSAAAAQGTMGSRPHPCASSARAARSRPPASPTAGGGSRCDASCASVARPRRARRRPRPRSPPPSARARSAPPPRAGSPRARSARPSQRHRQRSFSGLRPSWCLLSPAGSKPTSVGPAMAGTSLCVVSAPTRTPLHHFYRRDRLSRAGGQASCLWLTNR